MQTLQLECVLHFKGFHNENFRKLRFRNFWRLVALRRGVTIPRAVQATNHTNEDTIPRTQKNKHNCIDFLTIEPRFEE